MKIFGFVLIVWQGDLLKPKKEVKTVDGYKK
ncbi:hypothetical protein X924_02975 [Petrotoga sp. 9PWA.NaAc.5.4]|nr:hypothetical protein X924_02975 [Petrotoga sp. 9PWA.NaAc.5.4]